MAEGKKHKSSSLAWKMIAFPFKVVGKTIYYTGKGAYYAGKGLYLAGKATGNLIRKSAEKRRIENAKPKLSASYKKFQEIKPLAGSIDNLEKLIHSGGKVSIILGGRGAGKSALGMRILENLSAKSDSKVLAWGFDYSSIPSWIKPISSISELENNSFVLIDESGISFSSRNSMSELNKLLTELLLITRHKNISLFFIAQNSSNIEVNILRQADILLMKPHSLLQLDFERKIIKDLYSRVSRHFESLSSVPGLTYVYSGDFKGFISNELPGFWSEKVSKSFANEKIESKDSSSD